MREVVRSLRGRLGVSAIELGARVRDDSTLRPFGTFALQLAGKPEAGARLRVHVDDLTTDTTPARARRAQRERSYLGAGLTFDAGLGTSFRLPADIGVVGVRLVGRVAPRFGRAPAEVLGSARNEVWLAGEQHMGPPFSKWRCCRCSARGNWTRRH